MQVEENVRFLELHILSPVSWRGYVRGRERRVLQTSCPLCWLIRNSMGQAERMCDVGEGTREGEGMWEEENVQLEELHIVTTPECFCDMYWWIPTLPCLILAFPSVPYPTVRYLSLPYPTLVPYLLTLPLQVKKTPHNPKASLTNNESIPQALPSDPQGDGRLALPSKLAKTIGSVRRPIRKWKTRRNGFDDVQGD